MSMTSRGAKKKKTSRAGRKRGSYAQAERVLTLYDELLAGATVRIDEKAKELGVDRRQIQRDLAIVRARLGSRVALRPEGGWYVPRDRQRAEDRRTALAQVLAVELGAKLSAFLWGAPRMKAIQARVDRLRGELWSTDATRLGSWRRRVAVIAPGQKDYASRPEIGKCLELMLDAMVEERPVDLSYRSHNAALEGRAPRALRVHPYGIVFYRDGVYFIVQVAGNEPADLAGKRILLALDRLRDLRLGEAGGFRTPANFDARLFFGDAFGISQQGGPHELTIEIDAAHARWFLERTIHPSQKIEQRTDGSLLVTMRASGSHEIVDWILSLGEHAELVEPSTLRAEVQQRLRAAISRYGAGGDIFRPKPDASFPSSPKERKKP